MKLVLAVLAMCLCLGGCQVSEAEKRKWDLSGVHLELQRAAETLEFNGKAREAATEPKPKK